jgi:nicotinate-nucleotide--dimethylbenzimidazole phosphoribosyltransferase
MPLLATLGGAEIATMTGAVLQAAAERRVVVVDGFISTAAVAVAVALASASASVSASALSPAVLPCCVFAHGGAEAGHGRWLQALGVQPLLQLELRLGEGSGAALAWPLLVSALRLLDEMASFESAAVSIAVSIAVSTAVSTAVTTPVTGPGDAA